MTIKRWLSDPPLLFYAKILSHSITATLIKLVSLPLISPLSSHPLPSTPPLSVQPKLLTGFPLLTPPILIPASTWSLSGARLSLTTCLERGHSLAHIDNSSFSLSMTNSCLSLHRPMILLKKGICSSAADWNCIERLSYASL